MHNLIADMLDHTAAYRKSRMSLSLEEAVSLSLPGATEEYVISEAVERSTQGYHHGDKKKLKTLFAELQKRGIDVVDECEEDIYRCVRNIDGDRADFATVCHAKETMDSRGRGRLSQLGYRDGVLSARYGGLAAFMALCKRHGLIQQNRR